MSTTAVEDRLTDLLARAGTAVDVHPDLDAVLADDHTPAPVVELGRSPRANRRRLTLAAAALVALAAVGGGVVVLTGTDEPTDVATAPGAGAYPVLDVLPRGAVGTPYATDVDWLPSDDMPARAPRVRAVLGHRVADGAVASLVLVEVGLVQTGQPGAGRPQVQLSGDDDVVAAVEALGADAVIEGLDEEGLPTLALGELPEGIEALVGPGPAPTGPEHLLSIDALPADEGEDGDIERSVSARTGGDVPLAVLTEYGGAEPVEVGGRPGWHVPRIDGGIVAWTTAGGTNVMVDVRGYGPDDDLAVAEGVRFVDEDTWIRTYPQDGPPGPTVTLPPPTGSTDPSATTGPPTTAEPHDLVGRPAPPLPGDVVTGTWAGYDDRWTVVAFGATWCVPCQDLRTGLRARGDDGGFPDDVQLVEVLFDSPAEDVADHGRDPRPAAVVTSAPTFDEWGLGGVPAVAIVGPDGIVRSVLETGGPPEAIDAALAAARVDG